MKLSGRTISIICAVVWLTVLGLILINLPATGVGRILALSSLITASHVIFAGYYLLSRQQKIDTTMLILSCTVGLLLLMAPLALKHFPTLAAIFTVLFLVAMLLHNHVLSVGASPAIERLARYKIRLEIGIIGVIIIESLLFWLLKSAQVWIAAVVLVSIVVADYVVIMKHQIYKL